MYWTDELVGAAVDDEAFPLVVVPAMELAVVLALDADALLVALLAVVLTLDAEVVLTVHAEANAPAWALWRTMLSITLLLLLATNSCNI